MEIYSKVYDRYADAESTVRELQEVGIPDSDISLVANSNEIRHRQGDRARP